MIKHYTQLTTDEFHDIIALRTAIFVVEQNCPYQELDGKDKLSFHLFKHDETDNIIATLRIIPQGVSYNEVSIGRVVVAEKCRGQQLGHQILREALAFCHSEFGNVPIRISAQKHLANFYGQHGFVSTGKEYLEDGIPHVEMLRDFLKH